MAGKMCVVGLRYFVAWASTTAPYSPAARQYLALRGKQSLPRPDTKGPMQHQRKGALQRYLAVAAARARYEMAEKKKRLTVLRNEYINVFVTEDERAELVERAARAGMPQSALLGLLG